MTTDLPRLLDALPAGTLPPGRLVAPADGGPPAYWLSDGPAGPGAWARLRASHHRTGLWPLLLHGLSRDETRPWVVGEVSPAEMSAPDQHDPARLLAEAWAGVQPDPAEPAEPSDTLPFGTRWPGLAAPGELACSPDELADEFADFATDGQARLGLVPAARGADTLASVGWLGPCNVIGDAGELSAVLRSWEERFGVRVVGVGFDTLHLSVAAPPMSTGHAQQVAAEHFALCPDIVWQGSETLTAHADSILAVNSWSFWWD